METLEEYLKPSISEKLLQERKYLLDRLDPKRRAEYENTLLVDDIINKRYTPEQRAIWGRIDKANNEALLQEAFDKRAAERAAVQNDPIYQKYGKHTGYLPSEGTYQDAAALELGTAGRWAAGGKQLGVNILGSYVSGTLGLGAGLVSAIAHGDSHYIFTNELTETMAEWQAEVAENNLILKTHNLEQAPLLSWENLGSSAFWASNAANLGFVMGMAASMATPGVGGLAVTNRIFNLLGKGVKGIRSLGKAASKANRSKLFSSVNNTASATNRAAANALRTAGSTSKMGKNLSTLRNMTTAKNYTKNLLGTMYSATGEAALEASMMYTEAMKKNEEKSIDFLTKTLKHLMEDKDHKYFDEEGNFTEEGKAYYESAVDRQTTFLQEAEKATRNAAHTVGLLNIPLITAEAFLMTGGAALKATKAIKSLLKPLKSVKANKAAETSWYLFWKPRSIEHGVSANKLAPWLTGIGATAGGAIAEGLLETALGSVSEAAALYVDAVTSIYSNLLLNNKSLDSAKTLYEDYFKRISSSAVDILKSKMSANKLLNNEEFVAGMFMKLIGMPISLKTKVNEKGEPSLDVEFFLGSAFKDIYSIYGEQKQLQEKIDKVNKFLTSPNFSAKMKHFVMTNGFENLIQEASEKGDKFSAENAAMQQTLAEFIRMEEIGVFHEMKKYLNNLKNITPEEVKLLQDSIQIENPTTEEAAILAEDPKELANKIRERAYKAANKAETYTKYAKYAKDLYGDLDERFLGEWVWTLTHTPLIEDRMEELKGSILNKMGITLENLSPKNQEKINNVAKFFNTLETLPEELLGKVLYKLQQDLTNGIPTDLLGIMKSLKKEEEGKGQNPKIEEKRKEIEEYKGKIKAKQERVRKKEKAGEDAFWAKKDIEKYKNSIKKLEKEINDILKSNPYVNLENTIADYIKITAMRQAFIQRTALLIKNPAVFVKQKELQLLRVLASNMFISIENFITSLQELQEKEGTLTEKERKFLFQQGMRKILLEMLDLLSWKKEDKQESLWEFLTLFYVNLYNYEGLPEGYLAFILEEFLKIIALKNVSSIQRNTAIEEFQMFSGAAQEQYAKEFLEGYNYLVFDKIIEFGDISYTDILEDSSLTEDLKNTILLKIDTSTKNFKKLAELQRKENPGTMLWYKEEEENKSSNKGKTEPSQDSSGVPPEVDNPEDRRFLANLDTLTPEAANKAAEEALTEEAEELGVSLEELQKEKREEEIRKEKKRKRLEDFKKQAFFIYKNEEGETIRATAQKLDNGDYRFIFKHEDGGIWDDVAKAEFVKQKGLEGVISYLNDNAGFTTEVQKSTPEEYLGKSLDSFIETNVSKVVSTSTKTDKDISKETSNLTTESNQESETTNRVRNMVHYEYEFTLGSKVVRENKKNEKLEGESSDVSKIISKLLGFGLGLYNFFKSALWRDLDKKELNVTCLNYNSLSEDSKKKLLGEKQEQVKKAFNDFKDNKKLLFLTVPKDIFGEIKDESLKKLTITDTNGKEYIVLGIPFTNIVDARKGISTKNNTDVLLLEPILNLYNKIDGKEFPMSFVGTGQILQKDEGFTSIESNSILEKKDGITYVKSGFCIFRRRIGGINTGSYTVTLGVDTVSLNSIEDALKNAGINVASEITSEVLEFLKNLPIGKDVILQKMPDGNWYPKVLKTKRPANIVKEGEKEVKNFLNNTEFGKEFKKEAGNALKEYKKALEEYKKALEEYKAAQPTDIKLKMKELHNVVTKYLGTARKTVDSVQYFIKFSPITYSTYSLFVGNTKTDVKSILDKTNGNLDEAIEKIFTSLVTFSDRSLNTSMYFVKDLMSLDSWYAMLQSGLLLLNVDINNQNQSFAIDTGEEFTAGSTENSTKSYPTKEISFFLLGSTTAAPESVRFNTSTSKWEGLVNEEWKEADEKTQQLLNTLYKVENNSIVNNPPNITLEVLVNQLGEIQAQLKNHAIDYAPPTKEEVTGFGDLQIYIYNSGSSVIINIKDLKVIMFNIKHPKPEEITEDLKKECNGTSSKDSKDPRNLNDFDDIF